jgi:hypothetical protein
MRRLRARGGNQTPRSGRAAGHMQQLRGQTHRAVRGVRRAGSSEPQGTRRVPGSRALLLAAS